jgi:hypothetical protein
MRKSIHGGKNRATPSKGSGRGGEIGAVNPGTGRERGLAYAPTPGCELQNLRWWGRPMKQPPFACLIGPITAAYCLRLKLRAGTLQQWVRADLLSPFPPCFMQKCRDSSPSDWRREGTNLAYARNIGSAREVACLPTFMLYVPYLRAQGYH